MGRYVHIRATGGVLIGICVLCVSASVWLVLQLSARMHVIHTRNTCPCYMGCIHLCVINLFVEWLLPQVWAGIYVVHTYTFDMRRIHMCVVYAFVNWLVPQLPTGMYVFSQHTYV